MLKRFAALSLLLILLGALVTACGDGSDSTESSGSTAGSSTESGSEGGGEFDAAAFLEELPTERPKGIPKLEPLPEPPPKGLKVAILQCDQAGCENVLDIFREVAEGFDWDMKTFVFKSGSPAPQMQEAVNMPGVEYVVTQGVSRAVIEPQMKIAEQKGIQVIAATDTNPPEPKNSWPVTISDGNGYGQIPGEKLAAWAVGDSEGKAQVLNVTWPEVPVLAASAPGVEATIAKCPECSVAELPINYEDLAGGAVPSKVVAYLQSHPDTNYVLFPVGLYFNGVGPALRTAGLADKVKVGAMLIMEQTDEEALAKEELSAYWVTNSMEIAYLQVDAVARVDMGLKLPHEIYGNATQAYLCLPENAKECGEFNKGGPVGAAKAFEELWQIK